MKYTFFHFTRCDDLSEVKKCDDSSEVKKCIFHECQRHE